MAVTNLNDRFMNRAKEVVVDYFNKNNEFSTYEDITKDDVFIVWFCKTLQNWKALVSTTVPDGVYYEVTYSGDRYETYLDVYKKWENICIPDDDDFE